MAAPDAVLCAWYLGLDARELGLRLSRHESQWVRYLALGYLLDDTPAAVSAEELLRLSQSENETDRWMAAGLLPHWTAAERAEQPALHQRCVDALLAMLSDPAESVRQQAALAALQLEPVPPAAESMLRAAIMGEARWPLERPPPMTLYLAIERDDASRREAIELVAGRIDHATVDVISALRQVRPGELDGDLLSRVLEAGVNTAQVSRNEGQRAREELTALLLEAPESEQPQLGATVVPQLSSLVGHEDYQVVQWACVTLRDMGEAARPAIPALLGFDAARRPRDLRSFADEAMLAIAPDDPRVVAQVTARIDAARTATRVMPSEKRLMASVARFAGEQPGARGLLRPIVQDPTLGRRWGVGAHGQPGIAELVAEDPSKLIATADDAPVLAAVLDDPASLESSARRAALGRETELRRAAVGALGTLPRTSDEAIDAVARSMALLPADIWPFTMPTREARQDESQAARLEIIRRQRPLYSVGFDALASMLGRRPERLGAVIDVLNGNPQAIAHLFDLLIRSGDEPGVDPFEVPDGLGDDRLAAVLEALLVASRAWIELGHHPGTSFRAIARLPTKDPRGVRAVVRWSRCGRDSGIAVEATQALGEVRPVHPVAIDELRSILTGPPDVRWQAALDAVGAMGPLATPLLDELLAFAQPPNPPGFQETAALALLEVAPDDPRVQAVLERWPEPLEMDGDR